MRSKHSERRSTAAPPRCSATSSAKSYSAFHASLLIYIIELMSRSLMTFDDTAEIAQLRQRIREIIAPIFPRASAAVRRR